MADQTPRVVKLERVAHREGVERLRKAYHRLWQFSVQRVQCESQTDIQAAGCVGAQPAVQEGKS